MKRKGCKYHDSPNPCCDMCDDESHDNHTGWSGFTDHSINRDFKSEEEQKEFYRDLDNIED